MLASLAEDWEGWIRPVTQWKGGQGFKRHVQIVRGRVRGVGLEYDSF